jgi:hypothetical protein
MNEAIAYHTMRGALVISETPHASTLSYQEVPINHALHAIITILTLGLWGVAWILLIVKRSEKKVLLSVHPDGRIDEQSVTLRRHKRLMVVVPGAMLLYMVAALAIYITDESIEDAGAINLNPERIYTPAEISEIFQSNRARAELLFESGEVYVQGKISEFDQEDLTAVYLTRRPGYNFADLFSDGDWRVFRVHLSKSTVAHLNTGDGVYLRCGRIDVDAYAGRGKELVCKKPTSISYGPTPVPSPTP